GSAAREVRLVGRSMVERPSVGSGGLEERAQSLGRDVVVLATIVTLDLQALLLCEQALDLGAPERRDGAEQGGLAASAEELERRATEHRVRHAVEQLLE